MSSFPTKWRDKGGGGGGERSSMDALVCVKRGVGGVELTAVGNCVFKACVGGRAGRLAYEGARGIRKVFFDIQSHFFSSRVHIWHFTSLNIPNIKLRASKSTI